MSLIDDAVLLRMAEQEILGEAKRAAVRHSIAGVSGWQPCSKPNKRFLTNTLLQTMASNRILAQKKGNKTSVCKSERKLLRTSAVEKQSNFLYKKPIEITKKHILSAGSNKCNEKTDRLKQKQSKTAKVPKKKCNAINTKHKKT